MNTHARHLKRLAALAGTLTLTVVAGAAAAADDIAVMPRHAKLRDEVRLGTLTKAQARQIRADRRNVRIEHQSMLNAAHSNVNGGQGIAPPFVR